MFYFGGNILFFYIYFLLVPTFSLFKLKAILDWVTCFNGIALTCPYIYALPIRGVWEGCGICAVACIGYKSARDVDKCKSPADEKLSEPELLLP